ncbi:hypothetical protein ACFY0G_32395 [Streptomyces sp. NPDC001552]|uniref:hypothetical protein n=1 Tax=Streptomyces sp. NPDC001552 TaxID=3364587 RepID=UPI00368211BF
MMKMPRVLCASCGRDTAAGPVSGRLSKGRLWRHDAPGGHRGPDGLLVSCAGSLSIVDVLLPATQLTFDLGELGGEDPVEEPAGEPALFVI